MALVNLFARGTSAGMPWGGTWPGGRVFIEDDGTKTFHIRKRVNGWRYEVSTRCKSLTAAMKQWERFQLDPAAYDPSGERGARLYLDETLITQFIAWSEKRKNSVEWRAKQRRFLGWWAARLKGVDLRRVDLSQHVRKPLVGVHSEQHRVAVLKALYGWLRKVEHRITADEDPTLDALVTPQARVAQRTKSKVIPTEHYEKALAKLEQKWADLLVILAGTGWHCTELLRFARAGEVVELLPSQRTGGAAWLLLAPYHKNGEMQRTAVSEDVGAAAQRVLERGPFSLVRFYRAVRKACDEAEVKRFTPGRFRHTVATNAVQRGADLGAVATFLGHKSMATTKKFYATMAVAPKVPTLA
jgi:integrase